MRDGEGIKREKVEVEKGNDPARAGWKCRLSKTR